MNPKLSNSLGMTPQKASVQTAGGLAGILSSKIYVAVLTSEPPSSKHLDVGPGCGDNHSNVLSIYRNPLGRLQDPKHTEYHPSPSEDEELSRNTLTL